MEKNIAEKINSSTGRCQEIIFEFPLTEKKTL